MAQYENSLRQDLTYIGSACGGAINPCNIVFASWRPRIVVSVVSCRQERWSCGPEVAPPGGSEVTQGLEEGCRFSFGVGSVRGRSPLARGP